MTTAAQALAVAHSMADWTYSEDAAHDFDDKTSDCQGWVDAWADALGIGGALGPATPWNVGYMVAHTTLPKDSRFCHPARGDIIVLGDPNGTDDRALHAHTGVATSAATYISNYAPGVNVIERTIDNLPTMQLVVILRTGFAEADVVDPTVILGRADVAATTAYMEADSTTHVGPNPHPAATDVPVYANYLRRDGVKGFYVGLPEGVAWVGADHVTLRPVVADLLYTIVPGDTLKSVAQRFGVDEKALWQANNVPAGTLPTYRVKRGQQILIPASLRRTA
jgi:hypothetical protein